MSIPIKFIPRKQAGRPSDARVLAYETGTPIASPSRDPDGWFTTLATTKVRVFKVRDVDIALRFSLALPLEYARGTYVPFHLTVTCDDEQTIDLLCTPGAFAVLLDRRLHISEPSGRRADDDRGNGPDTVGMGRYWRPESDGEGPNTRVFEGEIVVGSQLLQSFTYPKLHLQYAVIVTVHADGITPLSKDPIFSVPVEVVYFPPRGVKPIAYAPKRGDESLQYIGNKPPILMVDL
ncbi:hypothetical protein EXIGLDRAFT_731311 [Exidia glandulosa HHB12029]|uniref:Arrestin-like N-terminal domain-containing protein n=1 Tax=Exidia glandulosa HHB12029 TaxID=1314781 RepID=A0A165BXT4_EXIGL|nr:hypothetical protein EXIGLDRAFT_731311 [Exidia glandulosa HHB12029]